MAEYGEWNRKGATISNKTAAKEYGVDWDFIVKGINAGKLEFRESSVWGNPFIRVLRRQLEDYIKEELGETHLQKRKHDDELRKVKSEISSLKKKLKELEAKKKALEVGDN